VAPHRSRKRSAEARILPVTGSAVIARGAEMTPTPELKPEIIEETLREAQERLAALQEWLTDIQARLDLSRRLVDESMQALNHARDALGLFFPNTT